MKSLTEGAELYCIDRVVRPTPGHPHYLMAQLEGVRTGQLYVWLFGNSSEGAVWTADSILELLPYKCVGKPSSVQKVSPEPPEKDGTKETRNKILRHALFERPARITGFYIANPRWDKGGPCYEENAAPIERGNPLTDGAELYRIHRDFRPKPGHPYYHIARVKGVSTWQLYVWLFGNSPEGAILTADLILDLLPYECVGEPRSVEKASLQYPPRETDDRQNAIPEVAGPIVFQEIPAREAGFAIGLL